MNWLKENLPVIILVVGLFVGYAELRLPTMVQAEMLRQGLVTNSSITSLQKDIKHLEGAFADQKVVHNDDRNRMDSKIERIVQILLEE